MTPVFVVTLGDTIAIVLGAILLLFVLFVMLSQWVKQSLCKHESYYETMSCDAICNKCQKNLGFIGDLRNKK